jgi:response regulator NasT
MLRVMLVDDTPQDPGLLKEGLVAAGYEVVSGSGSPVTLPERVRALNPDVIIIDTESPTRDVLEHIAAVSSSDPRPIVLFTADRQHASIQAALRAGVSAYVVEGMQPDRLQPILDVAVARFEQEQSLRQELRVAQDKLVERKVIERAKGFLMQQKSMTEDEAYRLLRSLAMERNLKLIDIAQQIVDVAKIIG